MIANIAWPRPEVYGSAWHQRFGAVLWTLALAVAGVACYAGAARGRVLEEHRAATRGRGS